MLVVDVVDVVDEVDEVVVDDVVVVESFGLGPLSGLSGLPGLSGLSVVLVVLLVVLVCSTGPRSTGSSMSAFGFITGGVPCPTWMMSDSWTSAALDDLSAGELSHAGRPAGLVPTLLSEM